VITRIWEATTAKRMKKARIVSNGIVAPLCTFQWCIEYVNVAGRSSARGRQTMVG